MTASTAYSIALSFVLGYGAACLKHWLTRKPKSSESAQTEIISATQVPVPMPAVATRRDNLAAVIRLLTEAHQQSWNVTQLNAYLEAAEVLMKACKPESKP